MSVVAAPRSKFEPVEFVTVVPSVATILARAFVVEVFPLVPETKMIFRFLASATKALG
jgi:hypothetical protein